MPASELRSGSAPLVVAVTGGVGSGKSSVARAFAALGATVIDADAIAREVVTEPAVRAALEAEFGSGVFTEEGALDRAALAGRVFDDPDALAALNGIVHPEVRARIDKELARLFAMGSDGASPLPEKRPLVLLDIPLLETSPYRDRADVILFIDAPLPDRVRRVHETRGWSEEELARREASQVPLTEKRSGSDVILANPDGAEGTIAEEALAERCRELLLEWSASSNETGGRED